MLSQSGVENSEQEYAIKLAWAESSFNPRAQNKKSSAYGLFGFLNSTWRSVGIDKTACGWCQIEAAKMYVSDRYHSFRRAYERQQEKGSY